MAQADTFGVIDTLPETVLLYEEIVCMAKIYREDGGNYREELEALYDYALFLHRQGNDEKAIRTAALLDSFYAPEDSDPDHLDNRAALNNLMGTCHMARQEYEDAEIRFRVALDLYRHLAEEDEDAALDVSENCTALAEVMTRTYRFSAAARLYLEVLNIYRRLADEDASEYARPLAMVCHTLVPFLDGRRTVKGTLPTEKVQTFSVCERALWDYVMRVDGAHRAELDVALNLLNGLSPEIAFPDEGTRVLREAEIEARKLTADNRSGYDTALAEICLKKAEELHDKRRLEEGEILTRKALELSQQLITADTDKGELFLERSYHRLGSVFRMTNRFKKAGKFLNTALEISRKLALTNPDEYQSKVVDCCISLGILFRKTNRYEEAESYHLEAVELAQTLLEKKPSADNIRRVLRAFGNYAILLSDMERYAEAEQYCRAGVEYYRKYGTGKRKEESYFAWINRILANLLRYTDRIEEAERRYHESMEIQRRLAKDNPEEENFPPVRFSQLKRFAGWDMLSE